MSTQIIFEYPLLANFILSFALSIWIFSSIKASGATEWGVSGAAFGTLCASLSTLGKALHQTPGSDAAINALAIWVFSIAVLAGIGFVIGAIAFKLFNRSQPQPGTSEILTKPCPFCAEAIKYEAIVCKHCQRDLPPVVK